MYEFVLNREEKENLLELAIHVAKVDKDPVQAEKAIIAKFREKLGLEDYDLRHKSFNEIMDELEASSFIGKTSILLEVLKIILADRKYHPQEKDVVSQIREKWGISDEDFNNICLWLENKDIILDKEELD